MKTQLFILIKLFLISEFLCSQTTIVLQPNSEEGKDAFIHRRLPHAQHGDHFDFAAMAWTNNGVPNVIKSLIEFNLSEIPQGSTIISAGLSLYAHVSPLNGHHSQLSGSNEAELLMITEPWLEDSVTWANQPSTTDSLVIKVPQSLEDVQDYLNMDVTYAVQQWVNNPESNHGLLFQLLSEEYWRCLIFASSDHDNPELHPKLEITYAEPFEFDGFLTLRPDGAEGKDAFLQSRLSSLNFGDHHDFSSMSGTNNGEPFEVRNLLTFSLNELPENARVKYTGLSLYSYDSPNNGPHRTLGGSNESELLGVTSVWDEHAVTWDTQPQTIDDLQVHLPESHSPFENYLNIDVTPIIRVMADHDTYVVHGMLLKLVDEEERYRNMIFASSDNPDSTLHPKLVVCYALETMSSEKRWTSTIRVYPNPVNDILNFASAKKEKLTIRLYNVFGQLIKTYKDSGSQTAIDVSGFSVGVYYLTVTDSSGSSTTRRFLKK